MVNAVSRRTERQAPLGTGSTCSATPFGAGTRLGGGGGNSGVEVDGRSVGVVAAVPDGTAGTGPGRAVMTGRSWSGSPADLCPEPLSATSAPAVSAVR
jgi:hypothetical protein